MDASLGKRLSEHLQSELPNLFFGIKSYELFCLLFAYKDNEADIRN